VAGQASDADGQAVDQRGAAPFIPETGSLTAMRKTIDSCRGCELFRDATQGVFGEGPKSAELMLVGEQPGDAEDREGAPFVGPAGSILDRALEQAGIDRGSAYVTNAVKHFKWRPRGSRRIHQTPRAGEIEACRPWLEAEIEAVSPRAVVAMGATAARSVFGTKVKVMSDRGRLLESPHAEIAAVTLHPSAVLRQRDKEARADALGALIADLKLVSSSLSA